jgi:hypothetical protein
MISSSEFADTPHSAASLIFTARAKPNGGSLASERPKGRLEMNMRTLTKITTGVAATALVCAGLLGAAGTAGATTQTGPSGNVTLPGVGSVTLTGKVVSIDGKYVTIVLDGTGRKIVVTWDEATKIIGDIKKDAKVKVITSALSELFGLIKADAITILG